MTLFAFIWLGYFILAEGFTINSSIQRRQLLEGASAVFTATCIFPEKAKADITNIVASSTAIRTVKRAQKQFASLELYAVNNDFAALMQSVQTPPLAEIRKACFTLVRGGEDGPDAETLSSSYQLFISSFEKMYVTAGLGLRGRKLREGEILGMFDETRNALNAFTEIAERSIKMRSMNTAVDDQQM
jgi:hypothetical protein